MSENLRTSHDSPLRILLVENSSRRIQTFTRWLPDDSDVVLRPVRIGNIAIEMLRRDRPRDWMGVMLDYDLNLFDKSAVYRCGGDVAQTMLARTDREIPVLVHSMNPAGAAFMCELLVGAGFDNVTCIPFEDVTRRDFLEWIDRCREVAVVHLEDE